MTSLEKLKSIATASLKANIVQTKQGDMLAAGSRQFASFWTRDFCHSVPGLIAINEQKVANNHLNIILEAIKSQQVPRLFDSIPSWLRVIGGSINYTNFPHMFWRAEYIGEHENQIIDGNILVMLASEKLFQTEFRNTILVKTALLHSAVIYFYQKFDKKYRLIVQPEFSDWQDSARREGIYLYTNLQFLIGIMWLEKYFRTPYSVNEILTSIKEHFLNTDGLPVDKIGGTQVGLDAALLVLEYAELLGINGQEYSEKLIRHSIWKMADIPGVPVDKKYPKSEISWTTRFAGLRHYHDGFVWSWLAAEAARVIYPYQPKEYSRIMEKLAEIAEENQTIHEIYDLNLKPVKTFAYSSEKNFSWGAAKIVEACSIEKQN